MGELCQVVSGCCGVDTTIEEFNVCFEENGGGMESLAGMMGGDVSVDAAFPGMDFSALGDDTNNDVDAGTLFGGDSVFGVDLTSSTGNLFDEDESVTGSTVVGGEPNLETNLASPEQDVQSENTDIESQPDLVTDSDQSG